MAPLVGLDDNFCNPKLCFRLCTCHIDFGTKSLNHAHSLYQVDILQVERVLAASHTLAYRSHLGYLQTATSLARGFLHFEHFDSSARREVQGSGWLF